MKVLLYFQLFNSLVDGQNFLALLLLQMHAFPLKVFDGLGQIALAIVNRCVMRRTTVSSSVNGGERATNALMAR